VVQTLLSHCVDQAVLKGALDPVRSRITAVQVICIDALQPVLAAYSFKEVVAAMRFCATLSPQEVRDLAQAAVESLWRLRSEHGGKRSYIRWAAGSVSGWMRRFKLYDFVGVRLSIPADLMSFFPAWVPHFLPGGSPSGLKSYFLASLLGHGAFGEVWTALNERWPQATPLVVKFGLGHEAGQRLSHELLASEQIKRAMPNNKYLSLVDFAQLDAVPPFLVFPAVNGFQNIHIFSLGEYLDAANLTNHPLTDLFVAQMLYQLSLAISPMHEKWMVHRDLKPSNLLIYEVPPTQPGSPTVWRLKILDFGIAGGPGFDTQDWHLGPSSERVQGQILGRCGSPPYAPKAQMEGERATPAHDIHALGMIAATVLLPNRRLEAESPLGNWLLEASVDGPLVQIVEDCVSMTVPNGRALMERLTEYLRARLRRQDSDDTVV
jgi:hypothetical protein